MNEELDMVGRVCLVTGATDGHGRAVAGQLARRGADVVLLGRNPEKCRRVQAEITAELTQTGNGGKSPEILLCDLSSREEIDRAASEYLAGGRPLHVLVNNAGLVTIGREESVDGHELGFAVNYLALFQLTLRLLPRLIESPPARIVNVSSDSYKIARLDLDDLALRSYSAAKSYSRSKLAIIYFTIELARRLEAGEFANSITVNAVDPGPVASNIGANNPGLLYRLVGPLIKNLFPSADRAARTAMMLATDRELATRTGGYYRSLNLRENPIDFDAELSQRLWQISADLTGADL
jgi:NAD(P)-dependent dehydrogenase (short-subunit alcohol dehydrogenase family)